MNTFSLVVLVVVALADGSQAPEPRAQAPVAAPDAKAPASLPEPRWQGLPGWLGFATVKPEVEKTRAYWTPRHPKAQVVLVTDVWKSVPEGTKVRLVSSAGPGEGTYVGTSDVSYGCDGNKATFAGFSSDKPLPEGPVWVLPPGAAEGLTSLPVKEVSASALGAPLPKGKTAASKDVRAYEAGGLGFLLTKTGKLRGQLTVLLGGKKAGTDSLSKGEMAGSEQSPLNLYDKDEVGVPRPEAAFQLGKEGPGVVVLGIRRYEGHIFKVAVRRGDKVRLINEDYEFLYFCAF
ncbi:hypothetical protein ATI61_12169 [Archangium gephyra]|uniref:Uncharacterized protein n=1 Tax=Archangium gephyra TaxID=48 RepID=A0AAC8T9Y0_9BACT|nr:hypothetical protein [Archangium gephyra]AKI98394.1 Hypothetical protein AA314_00021 [Archangium gephyra]REG20504.1 hypothetical protein ATI61_12169 [Archangium gephyra]